MLTRAPGPACVKGWVRVEPQEGHSGRGVFRTSRTGCSEPPSFPAGFSGSPNRRSPIPSPSSPRASPSASCLVVSCSWRRPCPCSPRSASFCWAILAHEAPLHKRYPFVSSADERCDGRPPRMLAAGSRSEPGTEVVVPRLGRAERGPQSPGPPLGSEEVLGTRRLHLYVEDETRRWLP